MINKAKRKIVCVTTVGLLITPIALSAALLATNTNEKIIDNTEVNAKYYLSPVTASVFDLSYLDETEPYTNPVVIYIAANSISSSESDKDVEKNEEETEEETENSKEKDNAVHSSVLDTEVPVAGLNFSSFNLSDQKLIDFFAELRNVESSTILTRVEERAEKIKEMKNSDSDDAEYTLGVALCPSYVNIRMEPSTETGTIIGKLYNGYVCTILSQVEMSDGEWYYVRSGDIEGYIKGEFVLTGAMSDALIENALRLVGTPGESGADVLFTPSQDSPVLFHISQGTQVVITDETEEYYIVSLDSASSGYVKKDDLEVKFTYKQAISINADRYDVESQYEAEGTTLAIETEETTTTTTATTDTETETMITSFTAEIATEAETTSVYPVSYEALYIGGTKYEGESVDASEIALLCTYSNGASGYVTGWSSDDISSILEAGNNEIHLTYGSSSYEIAVLANAIEPETSEQIVMNGIKAEYIGGGKYSGDVIPSTELQIYATYSDGTSLPVNGWACMEVGSALNTGSNVYTIWYGDFSTEVTITASERPVELEASPEVETEAQTVQTSAETQTETSEAVVASETTSNNDELRSQIVNYALQFVGNPYVYGGTDLINGTDCSGFTMGVYSHFGISTTRTSRSQAVAGREISLDQLQPGDLVFYTNTETGEIGHVAMYIGNGQIVHAASEVYGICTWDMYYRMPCKAVTFLD